MDCPGKCGGFNFDPTNMSKWRLHLAAVAAQKPQAPGHHAAVASQGAEGAGAGHDLLDIPQLIAWKPRFGRCGMFRLVVLGLSFLQGEGGGGCGGEVFFGICWGSVEGLKDLFAFEVLLKVCRVVL